MMVVPWLTGCAAAVVGGAVIVASAIHDRRDSGTILEDQRIEIRIRDQLHQPGGPGRGNHLKTISHNRIVLLVGEARSAEDKARAETIASQVPKVRRVINEIDIMEPVGLGRRSRDSLLTTQVKSALLGVDLEGFDAGHVNIVTVHGNVYIMGMVTREEGEAIAERARRQRGVRKLFKVFEYIDDGSEN